MLRLTTLLNFLMILTAADAALAQTPGVPLASAPRLSGAMGLEPLLPLITAIPSLPTPTGLLRRSGRGTQAQPP